MHEAAIPLLATWESFYSIIGTAAATLTGLMFIVISFVAGLQSRRTNTGEPIAAFSTPNVVHFCTALLIAALLNAPWQVLWNVSIPLGLCGLGGAIYIIVVVRRARHQTDYQLVLEDWLWHIIIPLASYAALVVAAILLPIDPAPVLFGVGAVTILFLFTGIHNAWDNLTYIAIQRSRLENGGQDENSPM